MAFDTTAEYYEVLANAAKRIESEGPALRDYLDAAPGKRVVDLACGTGLHVLFYAEQGAEVTGMDLSPGMIAYAERHRAHPRARYLVGDMRSVSGGPWDLAICLGNSLSLVTEDEDLRKTLASVRRSLAPGGLLVTQTLNYGNPSTEAPRHRIERGTHDGAEVVAIKSLVPQGRHTLLALTYYVEERGRIRSCAEPALLRNWRLEELQETAVANGLQVEGVYGGITRTPYEPAASSDLVLMLRRPA
jgi:SAM-dependent methyltransferase